MTADISRIFADPQKHYRSVVRQQGRLPTDAEENHAEEIDAWQEEATFRDVIAPIGSPDGGFRITLDPAVADDFTINGGTFYLGGVRIENPADISYLDQKSDNWLTMATPGDDIAAGSRAAIWLEADERLVTAVEDGELLEPALRGPDGAARSRFCWKVRQAESVAETCAEALEDVFGSDLFGLIDPETGLVTSPGTMTIGFTEDTPDLDLCKPAIDAAYLGDRNATFRVKITDPGRFVWGEDHGSHLYRVLLDTAGGTIHFQTHPRDEWQTPRAGDTIELLRGDTALDNGERIAERDGFFLTVDSGYADGTLATDMTGVDAWLADIAGASAFDAGTPVHLYLRLWNGGGDDAGEPDTAYMAAPAALGGTGITVTFAGLLRAGDSWTFSARPDAPAQVLPWAMASGMTPHSPRVYIAPLAIVDFGEMDVHDCRQRFRPLYKIHTCCSVTVGDGATSRGDTSSIAEAIDMLPPKGGTICLLPGTHRANVVVQGKRDIQFTGCHGLSQWLPEDDAAALLTLVDCANIHLAELAMTGGEAPCIIATTADPADPNLVNGPLSIVQCKLDAPYGYAVSGRFMDGVRIAECTVKAGPFPVSSPSDELSGHNAIYLQGSDLLIEQTVVDGAIPDTADPGQMAQGGIQIGGSSRSVVIRDCEVVEGRSSGIVLGSITYVPASGATDEQVRAMEEVDASAKLLEQYATEASQAQNGQFYSDQARKPEYRLYRDSKGCIKQIPVDPTPGADPNGDPTTVPISDGEIEEVVIERNRITGMGVNGIATYPLLPFTRNGDIAGDAIAVSRIRIANNRIDFCLLNDLPGTDVITDTQRLFTGFGGIALAIATDALFRENRIEDNGITGGAAICGISIILGEALRFEDNQIFRNGIFGRGAIPYGPNSGIDVKLATGGLPTFMADGPLPRRPDRPAFSAQNNTVDAPAGRALRVMAIGPVNVVSNRLTGANQSRLFSELLGSFGALADVWEGLSGKLRLYGVLDLVLDLLGGDSVHIANLGLAEDAITMLFAPKKDEQTGPEGTASPERPVGELLLYGLLNVGLNAGFRHPLQGGGEVMFANNQVSLKRSFGTAAEAVAEFAPGSPVDSRAGSESAFDGNFTANVFTSTFGYTNRKDSIGLQTGGFADLGSGGVGGVSSIFIASLDDVAFSDNQFEVESDRLLCLVNAMLAAATVRAQGNRGQEAAMGLRSIIAGAFKFIDVSHNQATLPIGVANALYNGQTTNAYNHSIL